MTHLQLHQIDNFTDLFSDSRFAGLLLYLEKQRPRLTQKEPHGMIQDSGRLDAYLDLLDKIRAVQRPPTASEPIVRPQGNYQASPSFAQNQP